MNVLTASAELRAEEAGGVPPVLFSLAAFSCLYLKNSCVTSGSNCKHRNASSSSSSSLLGGLVEERAALVGSKTIYCTTTIK